MGVTAAWGHGRWGVGATVVGTGPSLELAYARQNRHQGHGKSGLNRNPLGRDMDTDFRRHDGLAIKLKPPAREVT